MNDLERQVLRLIGEHEITAPDVFTDDDVGMAPVRDSINEAVQEIAMLTGGVTTKVHLTLRKDVAFYRANLTRDWFGWVEDAWLWDVQRRLDAVTILDLPSMDPRWMEREGDPRVYFQVGLDVVGFWPRPSATSDLVELTMTVIPGEYRTDDERVHVRREYERAIVNYAVADYWAGRGDARTAEQHYARYVEALGNRIGYTKADEIEHSLGRGVETATLPARP